MNMSLGNILFKKKAFHLVTVKIRKVNDIRKKFFDSGKRCENYMKAV